jgi:predicted DNA-binding transcriptional regulator AlpA
VKKDNKNLEDSFIGIRTVIYLSGFSRSTILRHAAAGKFPKPVIQEGNVTRWSLAEVIAWQDSRKRERDARISAASAPAPFVPETFAQGAVQEYFQTLPAWASGEKEH